MAFDGYTVRADAQGKGPRRIKGAPRTAGADCVEADNHGSSFL